jgi:hypothetical protein
MASPQGGEENKGKNLYENSEQFKKAFLLKAAYVFMLRGDF